MKGKAITINHYRGCSNRYHRQILLKWWDLKLTWGQYLILLAASYSHRTQIWSLLLSSCTLIDVFVEFWALKCWEFVNVKLNHLTIIWLQVCHYFETASKRLRSKSSKSLWQIVFHLICPLCLCRFGLARESRSSRLLNASSRSVACLRSLPFNRLIKRLIINVLHFVFKLICDGK